jgi:hypothetical protein
LLTGPVPRELASVFAAAVISSISFSVSDRAPMRVSTRLLSFDIDFSFRLRWYQLCIKPLVWIAGGVCHNDAEERDGCSGGLFHFIVGKLASTPAGEHPVIIVRHVVSFAAFSQPGEINLSKHTVTKLCIKAVVGIAGRACYQRAQTRWNQAA